MVKLTERETEIIKQVIDGKINREIGETLFISVHTVKRHLEAIFEKTGCHNKVQLAVWAITNNPEQFLNTTDTSVE